MSQYLGQCGTSLTSRDLNTLLAHFKAPASFQMGCFTVHVKLPIGLGLTLVAIPRSTPESVVFSVPFEQIKGDKSGGMARFLAGGIWGVAAPHIEKNIRSKLAAHGLPAGTVTLGQGVEGKTKVGLVTLHTKPLNAWLLARPPMAGFKVTLDSAWATEEALNLTLGIFHIGPEAAPAGPRGLRPPNYS